jgi:hypothetical protein
MHQARGDSSRCIRRQFRNDRHAFAFERRASGKVAGQRCCESFGAFKGSAYSGRVPRLLASPVPCRAADAFRKPRLFCGPSWSYSVRPAPAFREQAGFLASFRVRHHFPFWPDSLKHNARSCLEVLLSVKMFCRRRGHLLACLGNGSRDGWGDARNPSHERFIASLMRA